MATKTLLTQIKLRRDNNYNYRSDFIPLKGEVCLVDGAGGLRAKVGDGATAWNDLSYTDTAINEAIDNIIQRGYYYDGKFYADSAHAKELTPSDETIYIEASRSDIYVYDGTKYVTSNDNLPTANASTAGILKLYAEKGQNTDGTMTQKSITDNLDKKVSAIIDSVDTEMLILSTTT